MAIQQPVLDVPAERLRVFIRQHLHGGCKQLSEGDACRCPLCDLDRMVAALLWYEEEATALSTNLKLKHDMAVLASVNVLALDAGARSMAAIGTRHEQTTCVVASSQAQGSDPKA